MVGWDVIILICVAGLLVVCWLIYDHLNKLKIERRRKIILIYAIALILGVSLYFGVSMTPAKAFLYEKITHQPYPVKENKDIPDITDFKGILK